MLLLLFCGVGTLSVISANVEGNPSPTTDVEGNPSPTVNVEGA